MSYPGRPGPIASRTGFTIISTTYLLKIHKPYLCRYLFVSSHVLNCRLLTWLLDQPSFVAVAPWSQAPRRLRPSAASAAARPEAQWSLVYAKRRLKCHDDVYILSQGFVWINLISCNQYYLKRGFADGGFWKRANVPRAHATTFVQASLSQAVCIPVKHLSGHAKALVSWTLVTGTPERPGERGRRPRRRPQRPGDL